MGSVPVVAVQPGVHGLNAGSGAVEGLEVGHSRKLFWMNRSALPPAAGGYLPEGEFAP